LTFGARSFHAGANPTDGGVVTAGPYRFFRHPIYAAILYFLWPRCSPPKPHERGWSPRERVVAVRIGRRSVCFASVIPSTRRTRRDQTGRPLRPLTRGHRLVRTAGGRLVIPRFRRPPRSHRPNDEGHHLGGVGVERSP
jgi:hypothetical protein